MSATRFQSPIIRLCARHLLAGLGRRRTPSGHNRPVRHDRRILPRRNKRLLPLHPLDPNCRALYPALSSSYTSEGPTGVSERLGVAMRLVNLTVLPTGAALAVIAPTALEAVYQPSLVAGAVPFAILGVTIIFSAQSLLLITTLQAIGKTKPILGISLTATIIDLAAVGLGARPLGTTAGAIGRALLAIGMMTLAWWTLRRVLHAPITRGLSKALLVAILTATPLPTVDYLLATNLTLLHSSVFPLSLSSSLSLFSSSLDSSPF